MKRNIFLFVALSVSIVILFGLNLMTGSVHIPLSDIWTILSGRFTGKESWRFIIWDSRLPQALTAMLCGGSLSVCGLMLQTTFRNPLAGPDVFGISSGASLGVALVILLLGGTVETSMFTVSGFFAVLVMAFVGAILVTAFILFLSTVVRNSVLLLIVGIMVGYVASSAVTLLNFFAAEDSVKGYVVWGMGNFGGVSMEQIPIFAFLCLSGIIVSFLLMKPLNILLLGPQYAESLGVSTRRMRNVLLVVVGILTAVTTAFCGPISFIGLAVPHVARLLFRTENHQRLLSGTLLVGTVVALLCNLICFLPRESGMIPLNAVTPLIGAPIIIYVIMKRH